jgi:hypothetical protein
MVLQSVSVCELFASARWSERSLVRTPCEHMRGELWPVEGSTSLLNTPFKPKTLQTREVNEKMCVCCSITSLTRIAYGSVVRRQGRSRPFAWNQTRSSSSTGPTLDERPRATAAKSRTGQARTPGNRLASHPGLRPTGSPATTRRRGRRRSPRPRQQEVGLRPRAQSLGEEQQARSQRPRPWTSFSRLGLPHASGLPFLVVRECGRTRASRALRRAGGAARRPR